MYQVYFIVKNEKPDPIMVAEFETEEFAQVVADAGNKMYAGEREYYVEPVIGLEAVEPEDDDVFTEAYNEGIARDFERGEAQAYNREIDIANSVRI
jgi:hypothetical protein